MIPAHIPPHLAHCVRVHRIATPTEEHRKHIGSKARDGQKARSSEQRSESGKKGRENTKAIEQLIRVCWARPFTITTLMKKARLMELPEIGRKVYQNRLAHMVEKGILSVVGRDIHEKIFQASCKAGEHRE